ncbi:MAG: 50S ribosomal protein L25, partial [Acidobacteriota bacterium]
MKTIELNVERRSERGKNEARRTRVAGRIPAIVYGAGKANVPISIDRKSLSDAFRNGAGENAIFLLKLAGSDQSRHAMIKELQKDPLSRKALHIDFVRVMMDAKIRV